MEESAFDLIPDALRYRQALSVIHEVQVGGRCLGGSDPIHDSREDVPIDLRQVALAQAPQPGVHVRAVLGEFRKARDQHLLAVRTVRQHDTAYVRIDETK